MKGVIFNIMRYCTNDGPGIRTTVFLKGCPLSCAWCHNPESISSSPEVILLSERCIRCGECAGHCSDGAIRKKNDSYITNRDICTRCGQCIDACSAEARSIAGYSAEARDVIQEVLNDSVFFQQSGGGVTFSGGEPLYQHEFLHSLLTEAKEHGLHTAVDTTGFTKPKLLQKISEKTDLFLYDFKIFDRKRHKKFTGVSNEEICSNLKLLCDWKKNVIIRIPLMHGINDDDDNIQATGKFLSSIHSIKEIHLLPYHAAGTGKNERLGKDAPAGEFRPPEESRLTEIADEFRKYAFAVTIGG